MGKGTDRKGLSGPDDKPTFNNENLIQCVESLASQFSLMLGKFEETFEKISALAEKFDAFVTGLPAEIRQTLSYLAENGWYFDPDEREEHLWELSRIFHQGDICALDSHLIAYFQERVGTLESTITAGFPKRAAILHAAFRAHRRSEFELSIPVFLTQTDGICKDLTGVNLFFSNERERSTALCESLAINSIDEAFLIPLTKRFPISQNRNQRSGNFNGLNRHLVLHGESVDYGTEINSYKALSLLYFTARIIPYCSQRKSALPSAT